MLAGQPAFPGHPRWSARGADPRARGAFPCRHGRLAGDPDQGPAEPQRQAALRPGAGAPLGGRPAAAGGLHAHAACLRAPGLPRRRDLRDAGPARRAAGEVPRDGAGLPLRGHHRQVAGGRAGHGAGHADRQDRAPVRPGRRQAPRRPGACHLHAGHAAPVRLGGRAHLRHLGGDGRRVAGRARALRGRADQCLRPLLPVPAGARRGRVRHRDAGQVRRQAVGGLRLQPAGVRAAQWRAHPHQAGWPRGPAPRGAGRRAGRGAAGAAAGAAGAFLARAAVVAEAGRG